MAEPTRPEPSSPKSTTPTADSGPIPKPQVPVSGFQMPPLISPGIIPIPDPGQVDGQGIYAIPYSPYMGSMAGFYPNTLIPLRYNIPTGQDSGGASNEQGQELELRQQRGPQRQAVPRRLHFPFPLDLGLIIKLGAMIFLFSQDGSPNRLVLLIFFASLVYLYQTGLLSPFIQWLQQAGAPPRPRAPVQPQNGPPAAIDGQHNPQPGNDGVENLNQNQPVENQEQPDANGNNAEAEQRGNNLVQVVREIRMFVVGFLTSLFPGFNNNN